MKISRGALGVIALLAIPMFGLPQAFSRAADDVVPPTGTIVINSNRSATNSPNITLALTWSDGAGTGVSRMRFSNDGATWSAWEAPVTPRAYTLPAGPDGHRTVRVQYLDRANNRSVAYADYIRLDTALPTGTILINGGASATPTRAVTLGLTWSDGSGAGVSRMRFSDNGSTWTSWELPRATRGHVLPPGVGHHTVRVQYLDGANNYSMVYSDYIRLTTATVPSVVGWPRAEAEAEIISAGLVVGSVTYQLDPEIPAGSVVSVSPDEDSSVAPGTVVDLVVSNGSEANPTLFLPGDIPLDLVRIPAGSFQMGSPDTERSRQSNEGPVHTVNIGYDFYMGKYEVTDSQWLAIMEVWPGKTSSIASAAGPDYPISGVSWDDAKMFITALNEHITETGQGAATMRLPSEAEWEYACRAGTHTRFYYGDSLGVDDGCEDDGVRSQYMYYFGNNTGYKQPVGVRLPNAYGLYDMSGNVHEWCEDAYHLSYEGAPMDGSAWTVEPYGDYRVLRGGWRQYSAGGCRSAYRNNSPEGFGNGLPSYGFRLVSVR